MSYDEAIQVIGHLPGDDRTIVAVLTVVNAAADDEIEVAISGSHEPHERAHNCGRAAGLRDLAKLIVDSRENF